VKVLIIEDNIQLNTAITEFFNIKSFESVSVNDGLQAIQSIDSQAFNLYIVDINIPEINGLDLLKYIRKTDIYTPIIIITASLEIENFSTAFENGCNEYIKKPFHLKELDIRVNNLLSLPQTNRTTLTKELYYDFKSEEFVYKHTSIPLRHKEKRFCTLMMKKINNYVLFETIYDYVWEGEIKDNYPLRQLIAGLRKKLPLKIIHTKIKVGYIIQSTVRQ